MRKEIRILFRKDINSRPDLTVKGNKPNMSD